jgi:hypothetical protein
MGTESAVSPQVQGITKINVPTKATPRVVVHESWLYDLDTNIPKMKVASLYLEDA